MTTAVANRRSARRRGARMRGARRRRLGACACGVGEGASGSTIAVELRERSDRAIALLRAAGNVVQLAHLLATSTYGAWSAPTRTPRTSWTRSARRSSRRRQPFHEMFIRCNTGLVALIRGDTDTARGTRTATPSRWCRDLGALPFTSDSLRGLAAVAAVDGDRRCAALLFGAASTQIRRRRRSVEVRVDDVLRPGADGTRARRARGTPPL